MRGLTTPRLLRPIQDGWLIPEDERGALQAGRFQAMPLVVGSNADEGSLLTRDWPIDTLDAWREQLRLNFGAHADAAAAVYPASVDADARARVAEMFADTQFNYGTRLLAQSMVRREPRTWRYLFRRAERGLPQHGDEVPYVFGNLPAGAATEDHDLSRAMRRAWVAFARSAQPDTPGAPHWPPYVPGMDNHLVFDAGGGTGTHWRQEPLDFLERFYGA